LSNVNCEKILVPRLISYAQTARQRRQPESEDKPVFFSNSIYHTNYSY